VISTIIRKATEVRVEPAIAVDVFGFIVTVFGIVFGFVCAAVPLAVDIFAILAVRAVVVTINIGFIARRPMFKGHNLFSFPFVII
jgi:hypothetical protein